MDSSPLPPPSAIRLKVAHVVTMLELGGAQGNTIHTVRHLDQNHFDAQLWCGRGGFWDASVKTDLGRDGHLRFLCWLVRPIRPLSDLLAVFEMQAAFRRERPAIVHTHSSKAGILGRIAARLAGVPIIIHTFHGFGFNDRQFFLTRWIYVFLERRVAAYCDRLIFVSESNWKIAERLKIGDRSRYTLIRSGVPLQRLAEAKLSVDRAKTRRDLSLPADAEIVITLSAFKPQKNLSDFVDMAARVAEKRPNAHFVMIGDGEQRAHLEGLIAGKNLTDRFRLPGWITDPAQTLAAANVFVLTSLWEGLPRALVEALAVGVPAVCYQTDGVTDLLSSPEELRPQGDVVGLASAILRLLSDPEERRQRVAAQGPKVTRDYDISEMVRQQEMLYFDLARQTHR